jgi:2-oxoglutarate ferredoxin oxidoreductase subunit beta
MKRAVEWGETIPVGILYQNVRPAFESHFPALKEGPLVGRGVDRELLAKILESYS